MFAAEEARKDYGYHVYQREVLSSTYNVMCAC